MKKFVPLFLSLLAGTLASSASAAVMYPECPAIGANTGCAVLVTIGANNMATVAVDATQGPYDSSDDTLVGVLNNSSSTVGSLPLSSTTQDIFGFDGDGMCSSGYGVAGNCKLGLTQGDPYDYAGDEVTFVVKDAYNGVVNFTGGLAPGASAYFSLEESLSATDINPGPPSPNVSPEPGSIGLVSLAGASLLWAVKRRRSS